MYINWWFLLYFYYLYRRQRQFFDHSLFSCTKFGKKHNLSLLYKLKSKLNQILINVFCFYNLFLLYLCRCCRTIKNRQRLSHYLDLLLDCRFVMTVSQDKRTRMSAIYVRSLQETTQINFMDGLALFLVMVAVLNKS